MSDVERNASATRKMGALSAVLGVGLAILSVYAYHSAMSFNPVRLPFERLVGIEGWLPQGWAFFTRDPREERLLVYRRQGSSGWQPAWLTPHGRPQNAFGLDRASRAQGVELGQLYEKIRPASYETCEGPLAVCLERSKPVARLRNRMPRKTLCGELAIVKQKPLPWAWSAWETSSHMPILTARLEVRC